MRTRVWFLLLALILFAILGSVTLLSPLRFVVLGWLHGESFYRGRPTSYWTDALSDRDADVRNEATSALRNLGPRADENAVHALVKALDDDRSTVRWDAAHALGEIGKCPEEAIPAL